jgi:undecaprenyl-diphosphatase
MLSTPRRAAALAILLFIIAVAAASACVVMADPAGGEDPGSGQAAAGGDGDGRALSAFDAVVLGVVEGITEYLPVSSTGHLLLTEHILGISDDPEVRTAIQSYVIAIQFGAILAVVFLYWRRLVSIVRGIAGRDREGRRLAIVLVASFLPAAVIGILGETLIKDHLFALWPITAAWLVGGVAILLVATHDQRARLRPNDGAHMEDLTIRRAFVIGLLQCVAMWPGVSRSLITILGGRLVGLSTIAAVEYSFLLGLVTLTAATTYETVNGGAEIIATFGVLTPVLGVVAAFVSAAVAVKWMVAYLSRHSLAVFGWYRLALGVAVAALIVAGVL